MPVRQETNARFLVQVSIKSQSERKSKRKLLWAEKKVLSEDPGMNQVLDCRQSCVVTLLVFVLPDGVWWLRHPSHRIDLAGHQQKCQSHLIPHNLLPHAVELCSSSLQAYSKVPSLVPVLLAHRQLVQLVHNHAIECWRTKADFHPIAVFKFL